MLKVYRAERNAPPQLLVPLPPAAGAQSDLILTAVTYSLETNRLIFAVSGDDLGFHDRFH